MANIVYGRNPVLEAFQKDVDIEKVYLVDGLKGEYELKVRTYCEEHNVPISRIPHKKLDALSKYGNHQGVMVQISEIGYVDLDKLIAEKADQENVLFLILDGVTDTRNMGAIARSAKVFGADALITQTQGSAKINAHAIKASAGALIDLPVSRVQSLLIALEQLQENDYAIMTTDLEAEQYLHDLDLSGKVAIVIGSEDKGVRDKVINISDETFKIPQVSDFDSLNVSVATGIILYEYNKNIKK